MPGQHPEQAHDALKLLRLGRTLDEGRHGAGVVNVPDHASSSKAARPLQEREWHHSSFAELDGLAPVLDTRHTGAPEAQGCVEEP